MRVLVDTNLLVRMTDVSSTSSPTASAAAVSLLQSGARLVLMPQVIYEYWAVSSRPVAANGLGMTRSEVRECITDFLATFDFLKDERGIFQHWWHLIDKYDISGKTTHDARLVAAMLRHGIRRLLTFNGVHFSRFEQIEVVATQTVAAGNSN